MPETLAHVQRELQVSFPWQGLPFGDPAVISQGFVPNTLPKSVIETDLTQNLK